MSQTAAERATAFAIEKFKTHEALKAEATRIYGEYEEAKGEFQWAMAHPALPEGFDPSQHVEAGGTPEPAAAAPKRRGRPRKAAEAKPSDDVVVTPTNEGKGTVSEAGGLPVGTATAPEQPPAAPPAQAPAAAPVAPPAAAPQQPPVGDFFDPFAGN